MMRQHIPSWLDPPSECNLFPNVFNRQIPARVGSSWEDAFTCNSNQALEQISCKSLTIMGAKFMQLTFILQMAY
jgi:hypothetical protein